MSAAAAVSQQRRVVSCANCAAWQQEAAQRANRAAAAAAADAAASAAEQAALRASPWLNEDPIQGVSALDPQRVRPDSWKGMSRAQRDDILAAQALQARGWEEHSWAGTADSGT